MIKRDKEKSNIDNISQTESHALQDPKNNQCALKISEFKENCDPFHKSDSGKSDHEIAEVMGLGHDPPVGETACVVEQKESLPAEIAIGEQENDLDPNQQKAAL